MAIILISGFSNWGKTTIIKDIFARSYFKWGRVYPIPNVNNAVFTVETRSNDDYSKDTYISEWKERIKFAPHQPYHLFGAFCPSRERKNNSYDILTNHPFDQHGDIHLLHLVRKWDHHAELRMTEIRNYFSRIRHLHHHLIDADFNVQGDPARQVSRAQQAITILQSIFP
ncbi:MAG: hypothetical protein NTX44_00015 [Ignavibacteriales bacterium]|nr:hypothetical protein [Ignavibacteriales bacterium]